MIFDQLNKIYGSIKFLKTTRLTEQSGGKIYGKQTPSSDEVNDTEEEKRWLMKMRDEKYKVWYRHAALVDNRMYTNV